MKPSGGINQHNIGALCNGRLDGIESHGSRVGPHLLLDDIDTRTLSPDCKLLDRRSPEGISSPENDLFPLSPQRRRKLADGSGLPHSVDAYDHDHIRFFAEIERLHGLCAIHVEHLADFLAEDIHKFIFRHEFVALDTVFQVIDNFQRGIYAHIRSNQSLFNGIKNIIANARLSDDGPRNPLKEALVGLFNTFTENSHST